MKSTNCKVKANFFSKKPNKEGFFELRISHLKSFFASYFFPPGLGGGGTASFRLRIGDFGPIFFFFGSSMTERLVWPPFRLGSDYVSAANKREWRCWSILANCLRMARWQICADGSWTFPPLFFSFFLVLFCFHLNISLGPHGGGLEHAATFLCRLSCFFLFPLFYGSHNFKKKRTFLAFAECMYM